MEVSGGGVKGVVGRVYVAGRGEGHKGKWRCEVKGVGEKWRDVLLYQVHS